MHHKPNAAAPVQNLLKYVLALGIALLAPGAAHAGIIVYTGPTLTSTGTAINIDLNGDTVTDYVFSGQTAFTTSTLSNTVTTTNKTSSAALNLNDSVSGAFFVTGNRTLNSAQGTLTVMFVPIFMQFYSVGPATGTFPAGSDFYLGLSFDIAGQNHFGWALVNTNFSSNGISSGTATTQIKEYAYETVAGAGILAGQTTGGATATPEPSTFALFALGAAGVLVARRRRATHA
jgi:hypothetical protein